MSLTSYRAAPSRVIGLDLCARYLILFGFGLKALRRCGLHEPVLMSTRSTKGALLMARLLLLLSLYVQAA
jgi:hypothetical protein